MAMQQTNGTQDVLALLTAIKGNKVTSSTANNISTAGVQELVNQALRGNQGLAAISGLQKGAGVYNSTVNQQMTNDLLSQVAAKTEAMRAGTTTTQRTAPQVTGKEILSLMALMKAKGFTQQKWNDFKLGRVNTEAQSVGSWGDAGSSMGTSLGISDGNFVSNNPYQLYGSLGIGEGDASPAAFQAVSDLLSDSGSTFGSAASGAETVSGATNFSIPDMQIGSSATSVTGSTQLTGGVSSASTASNAGSAASAASSGTDILGGSGSSIGYLGSALDAYGASRTNKDYRRAVGSAMLNYWGWGAATPVVDAIARPISDKVMDRGYEDNGVAGSFQNEPLGTILSGRYNEKDVFTSMLDPANLFGGNEGGSVEGFLKQTLDPLGSLFGW